MGRMCPPQSVKMWPTPACLSVRATRCPPFRSAMDLLRAPLPELLPLDALAGHALLDQGLAHRRDIGEAGVAARQRAKLSVIEQPRGITRPEDQDGGTAEARLVEIGQDGAHGDDADLLGEEDCAAWVGAVEDEAARGALELHGISDLEATQPLRARPCG